ncbi:MAG: hemerythrin family protein [Candidatus Scalindua sp.]|nr:hemerythrin family protein [Candidatus Scalindua sp.]MBT6231151.1 hemerythrin family protein [Candidatus Scalindua sp.]
MIEWDVKFSVGVQRIDEEHKKLIDIINKAAVTNKFKKIRVVLATLDEMINYAGYHFLTEETYMVGSDYPEYLFHRNEHIGFTDKVIDFQNRVVSGDSQVVNEAQEFLKQWLVNHIQETDSRYTDWFNRNSLK